MDLVYMPEVLTYGSFRAPVYRDYEQPWNKNYFNYGKASSNYCPRQQQLSKSQSRHNCDLCKESKRRSLASYIRRKSRLNSCSEIDEVQEEEESEEHNVNNVNVDESETAEKNDVNATKDNQEKSEVKIHRNEWGKRRNDNKN